MEVTMRMVSPHPYGGGEHDHKEGYCLCLSKINVKKINGSRDHDDPGSDTKQSREVPCNDPCEESQNG